KDSQKIEAEKNLTRKEMDIRTKEEEHGNPEKTTRNRKNQRKEKTHPSLIEPKKKDSRNHHFAQRTHQDNMKRNINHLIKKNTRIRKCKQYHLENEYSSSDKESQSYQEPDQYESLSDSSESDKYK
ncbi:13327_t:CDS:2, partial [Gigaspora rosea]